MRWNHFSLFMLSAGVGFILLGVHNFARGETGQGSTWVAVGTAFFILARATRIMREKVIG